MSRRGQQGWNQLFDLLQAELAVRPSDAHVNMKLVQLYTSDGRQEEAVRHCLSTEKKGLLRHNLDWYTTVVHTLQVCSAHSVANLVHRVQVCYIRPQSVSSARMLAHYTSDAC